MGSRFTNIRNLRTLEHMITKNKDDEIRGTFFIEKQECQ